MSLFNLDRFRYEKTAASKDKECGSKSPESEKENKPAKPVRPVKTPHKSNPRGVVFEDVISLDTDDEVLSEPNTKISVTRKIKSSVQNSSTKEDHTSDEDVLDEKMSHLLEMFPQLSRVDLLEVISSTSTLDGAVALCLQRFGENKGKSRKRKHDLSSLSQDHKKIQANKRRRSSVDSNEAEDNKINDPSWEKQEAMVKRLQKRFPDQDKEELRMVLQEHDWNAEEALQVLEMFSDTDVSSSKSVESENMKTLSKDGTTSSEETKRNHNNKTNGEWKEPEDLISCISETEDSSTDATEDSEEETDPKNRKSSESKIKVGAVFSWLSKKSDSVSSEKEIKSSSSPKPSSTSSVTKAKPRFASESSIAQKQVAERKIKAHSSNEPISSEDESDDEDEAVSSDFGDSDEERDENRGLTETKKEILQFFQDASIDELTLISGCSIKKAQRIVELRPFDTWEMLCDVFHKGNGLSEELLLGCKVVLKERKVVLGLMSKCQSISKRMVKQVTEVMENGTASMHQPSVLNNQFKLKPYQLIGLKWLLLLHEHNLSGILADEMGLGKTIQAIAFLAKLFETGIDGPHLIIVPASTLDNWVRELKLWCPSLEVLIYYGSVDERRYLKHEILNNYVQFNVIVTTYNLAIGNDSDRSLFRKLPLVYAVFDEGHMLKNMNSLRYRHLMSINAKHRLLLTGTPLQNNLLELMSLLNFIMPSMFSSSTSQLSKMFSMKSHEDQSRFERDRISQAKRIMKPFILRRVKSEVLQQLPAKEETVEFCPMSEKQIPLYQNLFKKLKTAVIGEKRELSNVMMQLRKMANHPLLHRQYYTKEKLKAMSKLMLKEPTHFDADAALIQEDMEVMSDFELHRLCQQFSSISSYQLDIGLVLDSGKFHHLTKLLATHKSKGDRVVLFSQFTMMLDIVEVLLKHLKHRYVRLDGSTPIADRIVLIDEYNTDSDIFVFLLSTRAGGLGINLTTANVVILHDIDCNPYNDKQAEDRCHRVGQTRTVQVIKLISKDTIEDCILQLGQKKLKLEQDMTATEEGAEGTIPEDMASLLKASLGL
uniref:DNA helicase n=1 Tax=Oryzias latipes TaxID=8090 RepID=A0A3P9HKK4_ORYLA